MVKAGIFLPFFGGRSKRKRKQRWIGLMGPMGLMWYAPNGAKHQTPNAKRQKPKAKRQSTPGLFGLAFTSANRRQFRPEERAVWRGEYERFCQHLCSAVIGFGGIET
jgi:hypothetical protein